MYNLKIHIIFSYINLKRIKKESEKLYIACKKGKSYKTKYTKYGYNKELNYNFYGPIIGLIDGEIDYLNKLLKQSYEIEKYSCEINTLQDYKNKLINKMCENINDNSINYIKNNDEKYISFSKLIEKCKTQLDLKIAMNYINNYTLGYMNYNNKTENTLGLFSKLDNKLEKSKKKQIN